MLVFLLTDIENELTRAVPRPEGLDIALYQYHTLVEKIALEFKGDGLRHAGDKIFCVLDPEDAIRCALEIVRRMAPASQELDLRPQLKVALHSGEAHHVGDEYFGVDHDRSWKVLEAARGGHIMLSEAASQSLSPPPGSRLRSLGMHLLKDLLEPQELFVLTASDLAYEELKLPLSLSSFRHNLEPQSTPFFGRRKEMEEVGALLQDPSCRLVTLLSSGGFGKSRLAVQTAAEIIERFPGGVYVVNLASVRTEEQLLFNVAEGMKLAFSGTDEPKQQLFDTLREKELLLVLDNFEQIVSGVSLVQEILQAAPRIRLLLTSRQRLRIPGEKVYEVPGLELPRELVEEDLVRYPAIQLFVMAARKAKPDFNPSPAELVRAYGICRLLQGMPLGIELAAARVTHHTLSEIHRQIETNQEALATGPAHIPERHRSLRAVFEYSWGLLKEPHQRILGALSVFRSSFAPEAALKVARARPDDLDFLADQSLLVQKEGNYQFQEIVKYYAKGKLFDHAEERRAAEEDHARYFAAYVGARIHSGSARNQRQSLDEIASVIEDVQAAWNWALENGSSEEIGRMAEGLRLFYEVRGFYRDGRSAFQKASELLDQKGEWPKDLKLYSMALFATGYFCQKMSQDDEANRYFMSSLDVARLSPRMQKEMGYASMGLGLVAEDRGDIKIAYGHMNLAMTFFSKARLKTGQANVLNILSRLMERLGDARESRRLAEQGLRLFEVLQDMRGAAWSHILLGNVAMAQCRYNEAKQHYQKGLGGYVEFGDRSGIAWSFLNLGNVSMVLGEYNGARQLFREAQIINRELGDRRGLAYVFSQLGRVASAVGEYEDADHLYQEARSLYLAVGDKQGVEWAWQLAGNLACARNDIDRAERCYQESEHANPDNVSDSNWGWRLFHRGILEQLRGRLEESALLLEQSMERFRHANDDHSLAVALSQLGKVSFGLKQYALSEKYLKKALLLMVQAGYISRALDYLIALARVLVLKGKKETVYRILTFAFNHPSLRQEDRDRYRDDYAYVQEHTPEDVVLKVLEHSDEMTLEVLAAEVLDAPEIKGHSPLSEGRGPKKSPPKRHPGGRRPVVGGKKAGSGGRGRGSFRERPRRGGKKRR